MARAALTSSGVGRRRPPACWVRRSALRDRTAAGEDRRRPRRRHRHRVAGARTTSAGSASRASATRRGARRGPAATGSRNAAPARVTPPPRTTRSHVVGHDQRVDGPRDGAPGALDDGERDRVAGGRRSVDVGGGERPGCRLARRASAARSARRPPRRSAIAAPGGDGLEAAAQAAGARRAVRLEDDVADLAGEAARPAVEPAVEDDAGGDPGADRRGTRGRRSPPVWPRLGGRRRRP